MTSIARASVTMMYRAFMAIARASMTSMTLLVTIVLMGHFNGLRLGLRLRLRLRHRLRLMLGLRGRIIIAVSKLNVEFVEAILVVILIKITFLAYLLVIGV